MRASKPSRLWVAVPVAVMAAIQVASGLPTPGHLAQQGGAELQASFSRILFAPGKMALNLAHIPVFAALCWLWCRSLGPWTASRRRAALAAVGISLGFAVANELSQIAVPTRFATLGDVLLNSLGIVLGLLAFLVTDRGPKDPASSRLS